VSDDFTGKCLRCTCPPRETLGLFVAEQSLRRFRLAATSRQSFGASVEAPVTTVKNKAGRQEIVKTKAHDYYRHLGNKSGELGAPLARKKTEAGPR
jgi:hypothetical protein